MIAGTIISVFAQRLVRRLCVKCKEPHVATEEDCKVLGVDPSNPPNIFQAHQGGCDMCKGQGYKGRVAVAEILFLDDDLDEIIARGGNKVELRRMARQKGFKSMKDDGMLKVLDGLTSIAEVASNIDVTK